VKRATVAAAAVAIVAAIAVVAVRWVGGGDKSGGSGGPPPDSSEERPPAGSARTTPAGEAPPIPVPAADAAPAPERAREPEAAGDGERALDFDLRGPDDLPLARGTVFFDGERERGAPAPRVVQRDWRRDAPRLALPAWTAWIRAKADSVDDDLVNFDLASDPEAFDRAAPSERDGPPKTLRLHRRPGIFGQVRDVVDASSWFVAWRPRPAGDRRAYDGDEVAWGGGAKVAAVMRRGEVTSYSIVGLEPGSYLLTVVGDGLVGVAVDVEVADRMVRVDLQAQADERTTLLVRVIGLPDAERASVEFEWVDGAVPGGGWCAMQSVPAGDGAFQVTPSQPAPRSTMRRLLAGALAPDEHCVLALLRRGEVAATQPLANGQREATFTLGAEANLTVRLDLGSERAARRRLDLVPADALALLSGPPAAQDGDDAGGASATRTFRHRAPGDFMLQVWAPLSSALHHGEVWWPIERRAVTLRAGDQELALDAPVLHPLTVRFDRVRFGPDAKVQLTRRDFAKWPRYAAPDERGVARFDDVPAGDYTVAVIGDAAGQVDCTIPGTSDLTVEPTRRER
jgi:hypothetical protein